MQRVVDFFHVHAYGKGLIYCFTHLILVAGGRVRIYWEEWFIFGPNREGGVHSFQTLMADNLFHASLTHI